MAEKVKFMTDNAKKKILACHRSPAICPGCRKVIAEEEDMGKIEYVKTKRHTDVFFHTACMEKVWR